MKNQLKKALCMAIFVIFILNFSGCGTIVNQVKNNIGKGGTSAEKVIKSSDNKSQITVGGDWAEDKELNEDANIQASNRIKEKYIVVISEPTADFSADLSINEFAGLIKENVLSSAVNASATEPVDMTINGLPAKYFEVQGEVEKVKVRYMIAVAKSNNNFHQVTAWTLNSKYDENKEELKKTIQSFKEL